MTIRKQIIFLGLGIACAVIPLLGRNSFAIAPTSSAPPPNVLTPNVLIAQQAEFDEARGLFLEGTQLLALGDTDSIQLAIALFEDALPLLRAAEEPIGEAATLNNIGQAYDLLGEPEIAIEYFQQSLSLSQTNNNIVGEGATLDNIGTAYLAMGEHAIALDYFQQALPLRRESGDINGEATTLANLGWVHLALDDEETATEYFQPALAIFAVLGDLESIAEIEAVIGESVIWIE